MLKVEHLKLSYGAIKALHDININVEKGKIVTLIGANGAGKSSVLHSISNTVNGKSGTITLDGQNITNVRAHQIVERGLIQAPEGRHILTSMTVKENLKMGAYIRRDEVQVKRDMQHVYDLFPRLYERRRQMAGTLSGGEQQMLAMGRGLMAKPKVLMLDEPSMGLAPLLVKEIFEIIKDINKQGVTILLVEQNANMALSIADYAYVLEVGNITMEGKAQDLLNDGSLKKAYLGNA